MQSSKNSSESSFVKKLSSLKMSDMAVRIRKLTSDVTKRRLTLSLDSFERKLMKGFLILHPFISHNTVDVKRKLKHHLTAVVSSICSSWSPQEYHLSQPCDPTLKTCEHTTLLFHKNDESLHLHLHLILILFSSLFLKLQSKIIMKNIN